MNSNHFLVLFFLLNIGCVNRGQDVNSIYYENKFGDFGIDVEMNYYLQGQLEFQLIAPKIEHVSDPIAQNIFPQGISVFVYNSSLDTIASIFSDFAIQNKQDDLVQVEKNVVLKNIKNEQLNTETLFWDKNSKTIYTDDFVTINTNNEIIMGYGFVTDQSFSTYSLSNITGTIYL